MRHRTAPLLACALALAFSTAWGPCAELAGTPARPPDLDTAGLSVLDREVSFERDARPVLDSRCVVCHGCYDAPCQLLLSSPEGADRGATKIPVYDSSRLVAQPPTRLFIDARTTAEWRAKDFFSVLGTPAADGALPQDSVLLAMLALGRSHAFAANERLPDGVKLAIDRPLTCAAAGEFEAYARDHPQGGMPYGTAPLAQDELRVLATWVAQGAPAPAPPELGARAAADVQLWETFLNGPTLKERITARYLYEHWFLAHLAFSDLPQGPFFRVVRSRTAPGEPADEIATVRPYDDPGSAPFWYRLVPLHESIVHKTHIVYRLSPAKLARLRDLFLASAWEPTRLPGYTPEDAANPFLAFGEIPARSRYEYLLDDAQYFVMTFIRGPVCRGQVAVDVIEDQFWIAFLDPDHDLSVIDPRFLAKNAELLRVPAENGGRMLPGELWLAYNVDQHRYLDARAEAYDAIDPRHRGPALDWVWDGAKRNPNALLTVFRNFDNATVVKGFVGATPKTAWVMDYPIFERIYYDLVAGFDVFGNVAHQVATRLYMDHLRMQSENLFLTFLPADRREAIRASWYVGATTQVDYFVTDRLRALDHGTQIRFTGTDPKAELLEKIRAQAGAAAGPPDLLNRCAKPPCDRPGAGPTERAVERELRRLASVRGEWVAPMPEVSMLRVRVRGEGAGQDLVYALVHDVAHTNVAFMFGEDKRLLPADDVVTVVRGHFGSYPNFFFEVDADGVAGFASELLAVRSDADLERFVARHGVRRTSPGFWATLDWLNADLARREPTESGILDIGRYKNL
ncbi:MAG TPA: fatty acid cis/trans isomerase [Myxococcota bacterium]|nr:fatty acid cis/trans isomerase [Myxococcota bacterium]